jgi:two-component system sensor kinase FixL
MSAAQQDDPDRVIAEWRAANHKLKDAAAANQLLQSDKNYLASIVDSSNDAIVGIDLNGIVASWNRAAARMFGFAREEMMGQPVSRLFPPGLEAEEIEISARIGNGEVLEHYETVRLRKDGGAFPVSMMASPIHDAAGTIVGVAKIISDITEQKRVREELRSLQDEMVHLSRWNMMGMMAASLAHELNQPLTAMINYVRAARRALGDGPQAAKAVAFLEKAVDETKLAGGIIRSLREFIQKRETAREPQDLNSVIEDGLSLSLTVGAAARAKIRKTLAPDLPPVLMDRVQVQQVLLNLVRNAFEALQNHPGGMLVIETRPGEAGWVEVCVSDNGPGLAPEIVQQLFQPFQTNKQKGMGVGLSICQMIVEAHGGRIWTEPGRPQGATFRFTLPVADMP